MTYAELQTNVLSWLARSGDSDAVAKCPLWITLAENEIRMAMSRMMVSAAETVDVTYSIADAYNTLPTGFIRARSIVLSDGTTLDYVTPAVADQQEITTSKPRYYTVQGGKLRVIPSPDVTYTATFTYYALPSLSVTTTTNWLLTNHEKIYMFAALVEAYDYYGATDKKADKLNDLNRMLTELEITQSQGAVAGSLQQRVNRSTP